MERRLVLRAVTNLDDGDKRQIHNNKESEEKVAQIPLFKDARLLNNEVQNVIFLKGRNINVQDGAGEVPNDEEFPHEKNVKFSLGD